MPIHIDYETRSRINLPKEGLYKYASDPSTEIICMAWAVDDDAPQIWTPDQPLPMVVREYFTELRPRSIYAHNAAFERLITCEVLNPLVRIDTGPKKVWPAWYCTMAQARARALPGGLDNLGRCLKLNSLKDPRGVDLIKLLCVPDAYGDFNYDPDLLAEMYEYCKRDVDVERMAANITPPLSPLEFDEYVASERINDAGLRVDVDLAKAASAYATKEINELSEELAYLTEGKVNSPRQYQATKKYVLDFYGIPHDPDKARDALKETDSYEDKIRRAMSVVKTDRREGTTTRKLTFDKDARAKLLRLAETDHLDDHIRDFVELCDEASRSSVSKYQNMVSRASSKDWRVRGAYIYCGASQTLRYSSTGLQLHNFSRKTAEDPETLRADILAERPLNRVMDALASMLRPAIIAAPGNVLVWGDWSAIEARVLPWLAGCKGGEQVLNTFRTNDKNPDLPDLYMKSAADILNKPAETITKDERQIGKVVVLACGYQGGYRAFQSMARKMGVIMSDERAGEVVKLWRGRNSWAKTFWGAAQSAAILAVREPGTYHKAGRLTYFKPDADRLTPLCCILPSGHILSYPEPKLTQENGPFGWQTVLSCIKAAWHPRKGETEWGRVDLYGGLLVENATQSEASAILKNAQMELFKFDWPVVGHTHDEIMLEVADYECGYACDALKEFMDWVPEWAKGLPLVSETGFGERYGK